MSISRFGLPRLKGLCVTIIVLALLLAFSGCTAYGQVENTNAPGATALASTPNPTSTAVPSPTSSISLSTLPSTSTPVPTTVVPGNTSTPVSSSVPTEASVTAWKTWQSQSGGYQVEYPETWNVHEQAGPQGGVMTSFSPPGENVGVTITVKPGVEEPGNNDIPNTRCRPVTIDSIRGTLCFDTISFTSSVILQAQGKTFEIGIGKFLKEDISSHFISSFRLLK